MMRARWRNAALIAVTWIAAGALLWIAARGADWSTAWTLAREAHGVWLSLAVLLNLTILLLWAGLWRRFVDDRRPRAPYRAFLGVATLTSAIMNTVPLLAGHVSAVVLLVRRARLHPSAAVSVLALDQLGEGVAKLAVFALAALVIPLPAPMRAGMVAVAAGVALLVAALVAMRRGGERVARLPWVGAVVARASRDLALLHRPAVAGRALALALSMKAAEALAIAAVMRAFDVPLPAQFAIVVLAATSIATMLPLAPANLGAYEAAAAATYRWLGLSPEAALAVGIMQHACFLIPAIGAGVVTLVVDPSSLRAAREIPAD